jgi:hypothetical protein
MPAFAGMTVLIALSAIMTQSLRGDDILMEMTTFSTTSLITQNFFCSHPLPLAFSPLPALKIPYKNHAAGREDPVLVSDLDPDGLSFLFCHLGIGMPP